MEIKKEEKQKELEKRAFYFNDIIKKSQGNTASVWLKLVLANHLPGYEILIQQYGGDPETFRSVLENFMAAVQRLTEMFREGNGCRQLLPVAIFILVLYSYTKRFTNLSHLVLGAALGAAASHRRKASAFVIANSVVKNIN